APAADPAALPGNGNGARVVPRPTGGVRRTDDKTAADPAPGAGASADRPDSTGAQDSTEPGEAFRGR
ncbi:hypothetical protein, partial [Streptomyces sp. NPDC001155]